jgi:hypothetical protein
VRHRDKLMRWCSSIKSSVHAVLAKRGVRVEVSDLFGKTGNAMLDVVQLEPAYATRLASLRDLLAVVSAEVDRLDAMIDRVVLIGVKAKPSGRPTASPDTDCGDARSQRGRNSESCPLTGPAPSGMSDQK